MPAVTSTISVTYGTKVIGGGTELQPDGANPIRISVAYDLYSVEIDFIITAALATEIASVEAEFRKRRLDLTVTAGGDTRTLSEAAGTGFNHFATIEKRGEIIADSGSTRRYTARIECELPADRPGDAGLREADFSLELLETCQRRLVLSGVYTGLPATPSARATYDAAKAALIAAQIAGIGGGFEYDQTNEVAENNLADSELTFRIELLEVLDDQSTGTFNHPAIINPSLNITRLDVASNDTPSGGTVIKPQRVTIAYDAAIKKTTTTDLQTFYKGTVRPLLIQEGRATLQHTILYLDEESVDFQQSANRIGSTVVLVGIRPTGPARVFAYSLTVPKELSTGKVLPGVWSTNAFAKHEFQGPARQLIKVQETLSRLGTLGDLFDFTMPDGGLDRAKLGNFGTRIPDLEVIAGRRSWRKMSETVSPTAIRRGIEPFAVDVIEMTIETVYERRDKVAGRGSLEQF